MAVLYMRTKDGGFLAGDTEAGLTAYAYPSSPSSEQAKRRPAEVARDMMNRTNIALLPALVDRHKAWLADLQQHGTVA